MGPFPLLNCRLSQSAPKGVAAIDTYTPESIAAWASSLDSRTGLCFDIAGIHRGKVTFYAGPGEAGNQAIAVFDVPGAGTFVGRHLSGAMEDWVAGLLEEVKRLSPARSVQA